MRLIIIFGLLAALAIGVGIIAWKNKDLIAAGNIVPGEKLNVPAKYHVPLVESEQFRGNART